MTESVGEVALLPRMPSGVRVPRSDGAIEVVDLVKAYPVPGGVRRALDGISFSVARGEKLAVLGHNGAGKSTLVRIMAGIEQPSSGYVTRNISMSWPIALSGGFGGSMTGHDCVRFLSRIYRRPLAEMLDAVEDFAELGKYMRMPIKTFSSGMRARLAFGLSLAIDFDCYLIDEVISVGDQKFQSKSFDELFVKRRHKAMVIVSHNHEVIDQYCSSALVLRDGRGRVFSDTRLAFDIYASL